MEFTPKPPKKNHSTSYYEDADGDDYNDSAARKTDFGDVMSFQKKQEFI